GELVLCGRAKEVVIIHGRNLYPPDIVATATAAVRDAGLPAGPGAAFGVEVDGTERLVVVQSTDPADKAAADAAVAAVRAAVTAAHQVDVHDVVLVRPAEIPVTGSGKVRQAACRAAYLAGHLRRLGSRPGTAGQLDPVNVRDRLDGWPLPPLAGA